MWGETVSKDLKIFTGVSVSDCAKPDGDSYQLKLCALNHSVELDAPCFCHPSPVDTSQLGNYHSFRLREPSPQMRLFNLPLLDQYKKEHADIRGQLDAWRNDVERDTWETSQDIKRRYKSADFLSDNRVIFNIKGNSYRLAVQVQYRRGMVVIQWIGTHTEYSKKKF